MDIAKLSQFSVLIGKLYDAALAPSSWPEALEATRAFLETRTAALLAYDVLDKNAPWDWHVGYEPQFVRSYAEKYFAENPFMDEVALLGAGERGYSSVRPDYPDLLRSEFYHGWMKPQGLVDGAVLVADKTPTRIATLVTVRDERRGPFNDEDMALLELLYPHIRRAVLIGRVIGAAEQRADSLSAVLDSLTAGVFLLTAKGEIAQANAAAYAMLEPGGPTRTINGRLNFVQDGANRALRSALGATGGAASDIGGQGIAIPVDGADGAEFMAHLLPLDPDRRKAIDAGKEAAIILFVKKIDSTSAAAAAAVAARFRLTAQETRVLRAVVDLGGVPLAADILGVAPSTVRSHVTNIFDKTGVRSQAGLVRLLAEAASPFGAPR